MTAPDLQALAPFIALAGTIVLSLLLVAARRHHGLTASLAFVGLVLAGAALPLAARVAPRAVTPLLVIDGFGLLYVGLVLAAAAAVTLLAHGYLARQDDGPPAHAQREEFYVLLLLATLGAAVLATSAHVASLFLGLETLSVALYGLVAWRRDRAAAIEAGFKYLVLAGASSAVFLFGAALLYARFGALDLATLAAATATGTAGAAPGPLALAGFALVLAGLGFKLAIVPFHLWTPDVYQGAPAPVTAFIATASKGAVVAVLLRLVVPLGDAPPAGVGWLLAAFAAASMFVGNLLALRQDNLKRLLAYSSIAHLGYLLVAVVAGGTRAPVAATWYLAAYVATTLAAFGVVTALSPGGRDADRLDDVRGLFWRRPGLAAVLAFALLSLAGIPLTAGFVAKLHVVAAGVAATRWALVVLLAVNSAIGLYYYLRVLIAMAERGAAATPRSPAVPIVAGVALAALLVAIVWLGVWPAALPDVPPPYVAATP